jgi:hypothetical protein
VWGGGVVVKMLDFSQNHWPPRLTNLGISKNPI